LPAAGARYTDPKLRSATISNRLRGAPKHSASSSAAIAAFRAERPITPYLRTLLVEFARRAQPAHGPYYVGWPHGWLQPIADALKLMMKEDIVPRQADRWVYNLAPLVFLVPCMLIFATIPFAPGLGVADLNIGVLFFLAVSSLEIVGLFMGGWGSHNKYALLSAMRAVNQIIAYDLPFVFVALIPVVLAGSLQMSAIVAAQAGWFGWYASIRCSASWPSWPSWSPRWPPRTGYRSTSWRRSPSWWPASASSTAG
jgi:hypothetical protein